MFIWSPSCSWAESVYSARVCVGFRWALQLPSHSPSPSIQKNAAINLMCDFCLDHIITARSCRTSNSSIHVTCNVLAMSKKTNVKTVMIKGNTHKREYICKSCEKLAAEPQCSPGFCPTHAGTGSNLHVTLNLNVKTVGITLNYTKALCGKGYLPLLVSTAKPGQNHLPETAGPV